MQVTMIYFSQTGNTRRVADAMDAGFQEEGHTVRHVPMRQAQPEDASSADLLGVGAPSFQHRAPTPVRKYLRGTPSLTGRRAFVFATSGAAPGKVLYDLTRLLRAKGADVVGGFLSHATVSLPAPCLQGRLPNSPNEEDLARAKGFAKTMVRHVAAGRSGAVAGSRPDALRLPVGLYDLLGWVMTDPLVRLLSPQPKPDPSRCAQCGWCVDECPMGNIALEPHAVRGMECIRCYRCATGCPESAYKVNWFFANMLLFALYNPPFCRWFGELERGEQLY